MNLCNFILCIAILFLTPVYGQYADLVGKTYTERLSTIRQLYTNVIENKLPEVQFADTLAGMRHLAKSEKDKELLLEADLLEAIYEHRHGSGSLDKLYEVMETADRQEVDQIYCRALWTLGQHYWNHERYEEGFRVYILLDNRLADMSVDTFPDKAVYMDDIGKAYYAFDDLAKAAPYFEYVATLPVRDYYLNRWRQSVNTLGLLYQKLGQLDRSDTYFHMLQEQAGSSSEQWVGIATGNLGYNQYLRGNFEVAMLLLHEDIRVAERYDDFGLAVGSMIPVADILVQRGQLSEAKRYIDRADDYIRQSGQSDRWRHLYPVMSKWYTASGQSALAAAYLDSALVVNRKYNEKFNALKLMRADQYITASEQENRLQRLYAKADRQRLMRNGIIFGLGLVAVILLLLFRISVNRSRNQRKLQQLKLEQTEAELENARKLIDGYTQRILQKSEIIASIENTRPAPIDKDSLQQLRASIILTDDDWKDFKVQFHKLRPGFVDRLLARHADLTPAEIRYLLLLRLDMPNKQIAHALGISPDSLRVTWYRLRKKLGLSSQHQPANLFSTYFADI